MPVGKWKASDAGSARWAEGLQSGECVEGEDVAVDAGDVSSDVYVGSMRRMRLTGPGHALNIMARSRACTTVCAPPCVYYLTISGNEYTKADVSGSDGAIPGTKNAMAGAENADGRV
jgi:hypothetical protein